jgi:uncharacterized lipoprotein YddW (UPF0748 family)
MRYLLLVLAISLLTAIAAFSQERPPDPKHEFRSAWLTTAGGMDWPNEFHSPETQQAQLRSIIRAMKDRGMNAVVFQVHARGDAVYRSERLPWAYRLTRTTGQDPGWDPLAVAIEEAHRLGMELHAWYNVARMGNVGQPEVTDTDEPRHLYFVRPDLVRTPNNEIWLNLGIPEARAWAVDNVMEIVRNYAVDAVHFDFIRYPTNGFADDPQIQQAVGEDHININVWRRSNVTRFVEAVYDSVKAFRPEVKVGSAPVGHYRFSDGWAFLSGYGAVYQDSRAWAEAGIHDYIAPQIYWDIGSNCAPRFDWLVHDWVDNRHDRHIYVGTGPYQCGGLAELAQQIDSTRAIGAQGHLHFRWGTVSSGMPWGDRYRHPSIVPPMEWMDMTPAVGVEDLTAVWQTGSDTRVELSWSVPEADEDLRPAARFAIYRYTVYPVSKSGSTGGDGLIGVTGELSFTDRPSLDEAGYVYEVRALSHNNVEGAEATAAVSTAADPERRPAAFALEQNYPNPFNPGTRIAYRLDTPGWTTLRVYDLLGREVAVLVDGPMPAGAFEATFDGSHLASGTYVYVLENSGYRKSALMTLMK